MKQIIYTLLMQGKGIHFKKQYGEISKLRDVDELQSFQDRYLKSLLVHVYEQVPYYKRIFDAIHLIDNGSVDLSKFCEIPILTKHVVNEHLRELTASDYDTRRWEYNFSGGSTGEPTRFIQDTFYQSWVYATNHFYYRDMLGIDDVRCRKMVLWGSPQDLFRGKTGVKASVGAWLSNTVLLNSFRMSEEDMRRYLEAIDRFKPELLRGYAGSLFELCRFAERKKIRLRHTPRVVVSSAEMLSSEMRQTIEGFFGVKVFDFYGSRETASIAGECRGGLMHVFSFNNIVEVVDPQGDHVGDGQEGRILVTNLHNYSMPFLRYEIGDIATLGSQRCSCGCALPTLKKIHGREEEQFITKEGKIVIGYYFVHLIGVVLNKGFIKKFQVIQEEYERIRILAVLDTGLPDVERKEIEEKIKMQMGKECQVIWEFVKEIPTLKSGKFLYTKSLVKK